MKHRHLWMLAAWSAICFAFFAPLLLQIARLPNGDLGAQFYSFALYQFNEIAAGRWPLWSPGSYSGFPFAADTQSAVFYPPRLLTLLSSLPWGLSYYALELEAIGHVWLAGVFTYGLAFNQTRNHWAALLGAMAFGLGGYLVSYPIQQLAILETIAWLPLILLLLRRAFRPEARPVAWLMASASVLGLSLLAGHPQTFLQISYLTAAYYLFLARSRRWSWKWAMVLGGLYLLVVVGVSAVAWLPAVRYAAETTRATADYAFVATGFPLLDYLQTLVPGALTVWSPQYLGLATVFFVALAWGIRRYARQRLRAELLFWSMAALAAAWLSLGDKGILFEMAYRIAPGLNLFRQQERWVGIFSFSLALVAAQGFAIWLRASAAEGRGREQGLRRAQIVLVAGLAVAGLILFAANGATVDGWTATWVRQWFMLIIVIAVLALPLLLAGRSSLNATRKAQLQTAVPIAVVILLGIDLFLSTRPTMNLVAQSPTVFWPQPDWMATLQQDNPGRIDSQNLFVANVGEAYGLQDIRGISPLKAQAVERYEQLPRMLRWQLLNVTHVIAPDAIEPSLSLLTPVTESILPGESLAAGLYRFSNPFPRAWAVAAVLTADTDDSALALMMQPGFDAARQVVLTGEIPADLPLLSNAVTPLMTTEQTPRGLDITIDAEAPAVVVISEWWRDGWRVTLDDAETLPLLRAHAGLSAVLVPAGQHTVSLRFQPLDVWIGLALSLLALLAAVLIGWRWHPVIPLREILPSPVAGAIVTPVARSGISLLSWWIILIAIAMLGFGLRVYMIDHQELRGDEAFSYLFTRLPLGEVIPELIDQGDPHPPLHYLVLNVWVRLAGDSELALRYLSALAGTLLLPVLAVLGRRMAGTKTGLLAAALAAAAPGLVWLSQDVRNQYTLVILFAALATLVLVTPLPSDRNRRVAHRLIYALLAVLAVYHHYYGLFALLSHGLYLWFTPGRRRELPSWMAAGSAVFLVLLPWLLASSGNLLGAGQLSDPSQPELARHLTVTGVELLLGQALPASVARWLFLGSMVLAGYAGVVLLRRPTGTGWGAMLLGWLAIAFLGTYLVRFSRGTFNPFYISVAAPAWWLLISAGLVSLRQGGRWQRIVAIGALLALTVTLFIGLRNVYTNPAFSRSLGYRQVVARLSAAAGPNDILIDHFPDPVWDYYLRDSTLERSLQPATQETTAAETEMTLAQLAADHDRLWFVPYIGSVWDPENVVGRWLDDQLLIAEQGPYNRHQLTAYSDITRAADLLTPVGRAAGDIEMVAVYITVNGRPVDVAEPIALSPGDAIDVTLLWSGEAPLPTDYTTFVHLLDSNGALVAQHDGRPKDGTRPTTTWQPGEMILDRHSVTIPDGLTGDGRLVSGLYDSETVERLLFDDGTDAVTIGHVSLVP